VWSRQAQSDLAKSPRIVDVDIRTKTSLDDHCSKIGTQSISTVSSEAVRQVYDRCRRRSLPGE